MDSVLMLSVEGIAADERQRWRKRFGHELGQQWLDDLIVERAQLWQVDVLVFDPHGVQVGDHHLPRRPIDAGSIRGISIEDIDNSFFSFEKFHLAACQTCN